MAATETPSIHRETPGGRADKPEHAVAGSVTATREITRDIIPPPRGLPEKNQGSFKDYGSLTDISIAMTKPSRALAGSTDSNKSDIPRVALIADHHL